MNKKSQSQFGKVVFGHFFCPILKSQIYFWGKNKQNMHQTIMMLKIYFFKNIVTDKKMYF